MPEQVKRWNRICEQIETSCRTNNHCVPCTYPSCQRNVKLKENSARAFGKGYERDTPSGGARAVPGPKPLR